MSKIRINQIISITGINVTPSMLVALINKIGKARVKVNSDMLEILNALVNVDNKFDNYEDIIEKIINGDYQKEFGDAKINDKYIADGNFIDEYMKPMIVSIEEAIHKEHPMMPIKIYANQNSDNVEEYNYENKLHVVIGIDNEYLIRYIYNAKEIVSTLTNILAELFSMNVDDIKCTYIEDVDLFLED